MEPQSSPRSPSSPTWSLGALTDTSPWRNDLCWSFSPTAPSHGLCDVSKKLMPTADIGFHSPPEPCHSLSANRSHGWLTELVFWIVLVDYWSVGWLPGQPLSSPWVTSWVTAKEEGLLSWAINPMQLISDQVKKTKNKTGGWRDGSTVKSAWFCRGLGFGSQHPHSGLQPPVTPVSRDLIRSSDLCQEPDAQVVHKHTCRQTLIK